MEGEGSSMNPEVTSQVEEKDSTSKTESYSTSTQEGTQLVESFLKSKEFLTSELSAVFNAAKDSIVKEITSSVMEQLNKKLEDNLKLTAETYKRKDEQEEGVEKIIAGAKEMKMTY